MCDTDGLKAGTNPNPECLPNIPYIGKCCQPQPDLEVDDNGVLTKRAVLELVESVRNFLSGSSYAEGAFMIFTHAAVEGYKAWLVGEVGGLLADRSAFGWMYAVGYKKAKEDVMALLKAKP